MVCYFIELHFESHVAWVLQSHLNILRLLALSYLSMAAFDVTYWPPTKSYIVDKKSDSELCLGQIVTVYSESRTEPQTRTMRRVVTIL